MVGIPMFTRTSAIMSPRRLRSSMNLVAIMAPVGIHDPRRSCDGPPPAAIPSGAGTGAPTSGIVVIPKPPVGS